MTWYTLLRIVHSYWRWAVLMSAAIVLVRAIAGTRNGRDWKQADARAARFFATAVDIQFTLGMILYFGFSPFFPAIYHSFSETMQAPIARFFAIEHQTAMVIATTVVHIGMHRATRAHGRARHRAMRTTLIVFLVIVLVGIPWPSQSYGRPLFRTTW